MAKDYTKYNVAGVGEKFNKSRLVQAIVKDYIAKNTPNWEALQTAFPDNLQGKKSVLAKKSEVEKEKDFYMDAPFTLADGTEIVTCRQWGKDNILNFIAQAKTLGYAITAKSNVEEVTPSSDLTAAQIAEFKEQEAGIEGDYCANEWRATNLYEALIEAGDTAWADWTLQKIADAADESGILERVAEKLKERGETDRFLATVKKAEAMAKNTAEMMSVAKLVSDTDKDWAIKLYKKAEDKAESFSDIFHKGLPDKVKEIDKDWLIRLYQKAETVAADYGDISSLATKIKEFDKDWAIKLYQKAEQKADGSYDLRRLADLVFPFVDKDWAIKLLEKAGGKAEDFNDFLNIGDVYGKADGLADKDKARTFFEKAIPLIEDKWDRESLLESAQECLGNEDAFTKKIAKLEPFPFTIKNLDTTEIRDHIEKLILSKDEENCKLFKKSTIDFVNSNNSCYWIIPHTRNILNDFQGKSDDENLDWDVEIDLMVPAGKELDANPKKKYSLFYCWRSQTFKLDEDKDEEQEFFEILIKHFSDAQNIDDTGDDFYHTCITTLYCTICKMCQEDIRQDELVDLLLAVLEDQYLKDAEQGDFIWGVISETLTSLGVDLDEYKDESNLWREMYLVNFDDVATYLIENDVFDHDYIPS